MNQRRNAYSAKELDEAAAKITAAEAEVCNAWIEFWFFDVDNRVAQALKIVLNAVVKVWEKLVNLQAIETERDRDMKPYVAAEMERDRVNMEVENSQDDLRSALDELAIAALGLKYAIQSALGW